MSTVGVEELISCIEKFPDTDDDIQITKVIPRRNRKGQSIGHLAVLTDGTQVPIRATSKPRAKKTGPAKDFSMNSVVRAMVFIDIPDSYRYFTDIKLGTDPITGGGPSSYPRQLWSLLYVLQCAISSQRGMLQWISMKIVLTVIIRHIAALRSDVSPEDQVVIDRWLKSRRKVPSAAQLSRFLRSLDDRGWDAKRELREQGAQLCIDLGRFNPAKPVSDMTNAIIGDGTVLKAACNTTDPITVDNDGTITRRRVDDFALLHTEAGNEKIYGAKGAAIWSPSPDRHGTVCLGFDWIDKTNPSHEAAGALELTRDSCKLLHAQGRQPSNYAYDRAATHIDQEALNSLGMYLTTRAIGDKLDPKSDSHFLKPKYIGSFTPSDGCTCHYQLFAIKKKLHLQVLDDSGNDIYLPIPHGFRSLIVKGKRYNYSDHTIPCQTDHGKEHTVSIPWNGWNTFNNKGKNRIDPVDKEQYKKILQYLQPHAPSTTDFDQAFGIRERSETMHSILDALLPFKVLQRWGRASKSGFIYGYLIGHNLIARQALLNGMSHLLHPDA